MLQSKKLADIRSDCPPAATWRARKRPPPELKGPWCLAPYASYHSARCDRELRQPLERLADEPLELLPCVIRSSNSSASAAAARATALAAGTAATRVVSALTVGAATGAPCRAGLAPWPAAFFRAASSLAFVRLAALRAESSLASSVSRASNARASLQ